MKYIYILCFIGFTGILGCKKTEFLDKKPSTNLILPTTLADFQALLDYTEIFNRTGALAQLASDDYVVASFASYQSAITATERNSYIWADDIYGGETSLVNWNNLYTQVYYANGVLDGLNKSSESTSDKGQYLKGWALFARAYAFYDLTRNYCKAYQASSANNDLGIPLRLKPAIDYTLQRSTLQQTFDQIIGDLLIAENLLPAQRPSANLNRPSKVAVYALLSRIYLDMRNYQQSELYADKSLGLYSTIIDYNTIPKTSAFPFSVTNDELIYNTSASGAYNFNITNAVSGTRISPDLIALYSANDLRLLHYFTRQTDNSYVKKFGYNGLNLYPFTGLATDEQYLIKAECLARRGEIVQSMDKLNQLIIKRWNSNATVPSEPYVNIVANNKEEALTMILLERRKELVWRGLRWFDLKRLNKENFAITITRTLNGVTYTLPPNDTKYIFPIPDDEVLLSGLQQNIR